MGPGNVRELLILIGDEGVFILINTIDYLAEKATTMSFFAHLSLAADMAHRKLEETYCNPMAATSTGLRRWADDCGCEKEERAVFARSSRSRTSASTYSMDKLRAHTRERDGDLTKD